VKSRCAIVGQCSNFAESVQKEVGIPHLYCLSPKRLAVLWFLLAASICAQTQGPLLSPADCTNVRLETALHVYRAPGPMQVIAIDYRNTTADACALHPDSLSRPFKPLLTLVPGETAHTSFRWSTEFSAPDIPCREVPFRTINANRPPNGIERFPNGLLVASPLMLPNVCSEVQFGAYYHGAFVPDWPVDVLAVEPNLPILRLTVAKPAFYGEPPTFHLEIDRLNSKLPASKDGCPILFRNLRNPSGFTQIDEVTPSHGLSCVPEKEGAAADNRTTFEISALQGSASAEHGQKTFRLSQFLGYSPWGEMLVADSNSVTLEDPPDPTKISRKWGQTEQGVRVDLTLDKLTYLPGEDIPLHVAAEVLSSVNPVYTERFRRRAAFFADFARAFHLSIRNENGPLPGSERSGNLSYPLHGGGSSGPLVCPPAH